jgi:long-chain alkane monooxygenase
MSSFPSLVPLGAIPGQPLRSDAPGGVEFDVVPVTTLGWWAEFVDHVVPVLQRRGLMQTAYVPGTLREKLSRNGPYPPDRHPARRLRPGAPAVSFSAA